VDDFDDFDAFDGLDAVDAFDDFDAFVARVDAGRVALDRAARRVRSGAGSGSAAGGGGGEGAARPMPKPGIRRPNIPPADSASPTRGARRLLSSIIERMNSATSTGKLAIRWLMSSAVRTVREI